jgi:putative ABC transport system ATP-binding protein
MIAIRSLSFHYQHSATIHFPDWQAESAESVLLMGKSGSGKTTLLHLVAGLLRPATGSIRIAETDIASLSPRECDLFRGCSIGLVFQKAHLLDSLSIGDNLLAAQYFAGLSTDRKRAEMVLAELGLADKWKRKPYELSQGEAQRVSIARAVLNKPAIILADEPTASLDDDNCQAVISLLMAQAEQYNATLLVATHDQRLRQVIGKHLNLTQV